MVSEHTLIETVQTMCWTIQKWSKRRCLGTWTLYDRSRFVGIWKDNIRWKEKSFDEEGKEIGEYVNGEEEIYYKPSF